MTYTSCINEEDENLIHTSYLFIYLVFPFRSQRIEKFTLHDATSLCDRSLKCSFQINK